MNTSDFEKILTGGHPNSLGNTVEVVETVLADQRLLDELYQCYFSADEVVRLRVSSAMKRICLQHPDWLMPYLDRFLNEVGKIDQPSAQWTLAQIFLWMQGSMTDTQEQKAIEVLKHNLVHNGDWIVQNHTIETLGTWASNDERLKTWLVPQLRQRADHERRKSVAKRARKMLHTLAGKSPAP